MTTAQVSRWLTILHAAEVNRYIQGCAPNTKLFQMAVKVVPPFSAVTIIYLDNCQIAPVDVY